jgi:hypothetical protein
MSKLTLKTEGDRYVLVTRRFAAPPEAVYRAHTEPDLVQKWLLGPPGWTMPVCISEAKPGGKIRYEWTDGKGGGFYLTGEYLELTPFSRIVHGRAHASARPDARQSRRNQFCARWRRHADDHADDAARRNDADDDAVERHGDRHGGELRPTGQHELKRGAARLVAPASRRYSITACSGPAACFLSAALVEPIMIASGIAQAVKIITIW